MLWAGTMAEESTSLSRSFEEAEQELRSSWTSSVKTAGAVLMAAGVICGMIGGAAIALGAFSAAVAVGLAIGAVSAAVGSIPVAEWLRHSRRSEALRRVVDGQRYFEALLLDAKTEREQARRELDAARAQGAAVAGLLQTFAATRALPGNDDDDQ